MIAPLESTATIGSEDVGASPAFGKPVEMAGEGSLQVELAKPIQQRISIIGTISDICPKWKVGEKDGRCSFIEPRQIIIEPAERLLRNAGLLVTLAFSRIESDELPAAMMEVVIQP